MASSLVDRATSEGLIGPDWATNIDICDMLNREPGKTKQVVKSLKKRINSKSSIVQLLSLTLLETLVKNCGDIVHMHVAKKDIPHEMVKIVKKKPDFHVKEKILVLIDAWQEAFGGPRAQYPQYYIAYQELLRSGAVFPRRTEQHVPIFTPPQSHPITYHPQSSHSPDSYQDESRPTAPDLVTLSLADIQNARGTMGVVAEMLNAVDPSNNEGLIQEVIIDLVKQCRSYKQRVVHLVNTTTDEELLGKGLALNDDLEQVLAKHDAIAAGIVVRVEKPEFSSTPKDGGGTGKTHSASIKPNQGSGTSGGTSNQPLFDQSLLPAPPSKEKDESKSTMEKMDPRMDLLTGDDFNKKISVDTLAIVPINATIDTSASDQNVLALADMFVQNDNAHSSNSASPEDPYSSYSALETPPTSAGPSMSQQQQSALHSNGSLSNPYISQYDPARNVRQTHMVPASPTWDGQAAQSLYLQQKPLNFGVNDQGREAFPPPPWEAQPAEVDQPVNSQVPTIQSTQLVGMYPQQMQSPHFSGLPSFLGQYSYPVQGLTRAGTGIFPQIRGNPMGLAGYSYDPTTAQNYNHGMPLYTYASPNEISQRMYGLSLQGNNGYMNINSYNMDASSSLTPQQQQSLSKPEDKLFGDLLSIAKSNKKKFPISKKESL